MDRVTSLRDKNIYYFKCKEQQQQEVSGHSHLFTDRNVNSDVRELYGMKEFEWGYICLFVCGREDEVKKDEMKEYNETIFAGN